MKKIISSFFILFLPFLIFAQEFKEIEIKSDISAATVYLNSAEITRVKNLNIPQGRILLIFKGLSPVLDDKTVRVTTDESIDILQISTVTNYLTNEEDKPQIKILNDSMEIINLKIQVCIDELDAYKIEKELLVVNKEMGGENEGVDLDELKASADFYRLRIMEINKKVSEINLKYLKLTKDKNRIQSQLLELNAGTGYSRKEVHILLETEKPVTTDVTLKYIVNYAGWSPSYDLKADDTDGPINFIYRAKVYNNTGIDWKNIELTLSTSDANLTNSKPNLTTWFLKESATVDNNIYKGEGYVQTNQVPRANYEQQAYQNIGGVDLDNDYIFEYEAVVPVLSHEFKIDKKYTVPADDKPYLVDIEEKQLAATYKHTAITKLDPAVFLLAGVTGWQDLNLIDGPANVYYAGSYIGKSFITTRNVSDTLDFSLGRDNRVIVTRHSLSKYSQTQVIGNKKKTTFTYQYEIKNNHKSAVDLEIIDQIPISQSSEIEVKTIELSGGELNISTGEVKWKYKLNSGEMKKIDFSFWVKYPKNTYVPVIQNESKNIRYFY